MTTAELSHRATYVLYVVEELFRRQGYAPTYQEIADAAGMTTKSQVRPLLDELKDAGELTFTPGVGRSLVLKGDANA